MPITYPLDFPTGLVAQFQMGLRTAVARVESPFSLKEQVYKYSGELWEIEVGLALLPRDLAEQFNAFLLKLRGQTGTFTMGNPNAAAPRGSWGGTPLVKGAGQTGDTLLIDGLPTSTANVVRQGDYFQIGTGANTRLYQALDDANSNGSGEVTLTIAPTLKGSPADNAPVIYNNAKGLFRLNGNIQPFQINNNSFYSMSFTATESY